jgi:hypothetical protein
VSEAAVETETPAEEEFDAERVAELVAELTIEDLAPQIAEAGPRKLEALREAEASGQNRVGIFELIDRRRAELDTPPEPEEEEEDDGEDEEVADAPVDEIKPVIRVGDWVTLGAGRGVPKHAVNLDAVVVVANVKQSEGGDTLSPLGYDYQDDSATFQVRVRNTGETLQVTRKAIIAHGTQQAELGSRP